MLPAFTHHYIITGKGLFRHANLRPGPSVLIKGSFRGCTYNNFELQQVPRVLVYPGEGGTCTTTVLSSLDRMYVVVHDRAELKNAGLEHLLTHSYTLHNPCHIAMT